MSSTDTAQRLFAGQPSLGASNFAIAAAALAGTLALLHRGIAPSRPGSGELDRENPDKLSTLVDKPA